MRPCEPKNLSENPEDGKLTGHKRLTLAGAALVPENLTRSQRREFQRRVVKLGEFAVLTGSGESHGKAAKRLRVPVPTLWRWRKRFAALGVIGLIPGTDRCGRKSVAEQFGLTAEIIAGVQRLQLAGCSPASAWKQFASDPLCPPLLSGYICSTRNLSPSLIKVVRLQKKSATVLCGHGFTHVETE